MVKISQSRVNYMSAGFTTYKRLQGNICYKYRNISDAGISTCDLVT